MVTNPVQRRTIVKTIGAVLETLMGSKHFTWGAFGVFLLVTVSLSWFIDGWTNVFWGEKGIGVLQIFVVGIIWSIMFSYFKKNIKFERKLDVVPKYPLPHKQLVWFLSYNFDKSTMEDLIKFPKKIKDEHNRNNWRMPYEAVQYHKNGIEFLYVITSSGKNASNDQFDCFKEFITVAFGNNFQVERHNDSGINFEDLQAVYQSIEECYKIAAGKGINEDDVIVDITGGQKTTSIAGSLVTLYKDRKCQYVSTENYKVTSFDIKYEVLE